MSSSSKGSGLSGLRGWRASFVLFLAFVVPVTPILAEIQQDAATRDTTQTTAPQLQAGRSHAPMSSYLVALDLLGKRNLRDFPAAAFLPGTDTKACDKGRSDADRETDGTLWFILGLVLSIWGPVLAYVITPSVPEANIKGKTAAYASTYSDCYQEAAKDIHVKWAWYGLGTLVLAAMLAYLVVLLANKGMSK